MAELIKLEAEVSEE
jgi:hypothetical protein